MPNSLVARKASKARKGPHQPNQSLNSSMSLTKGSSAIASLGAIASPTMPLFPTATRRTLRYAENMVTIGAPAGVISNYIFRGNDLYDPNVTSTGHQPMGFDQMMVFFDHFIVERAVCTARFYNMGPTVPNVYVRVDSNNGAITDPVVLLESGGCITDVLSPSGNSGAYKTLSCTMDVSKFHGVNKSALTSMDSLQGSIGSSPTDGIYFHVGCWEPGGNTSNVKFEVVIDFVSIFTEPRVPSLSRLQLVQREAETRRIRKAVRDVGLVPIETAGCVGAVHK